MVRVIYCPHCHSFGPITENAIGKAVRCSGCSTIFTVPAPNAGSTPAIRAAARTIATNLAASSRTFIRVIGGSRIVLGTRRQLRTSFRIIVRAVQQSSENQDSGTGAALAFYAVFAIVPLLFMAILWCAIFFGQERTTHKIEGWVNKAIGEEIGTSVADDLEELLDDIKAKIKSDFRAGRFWRPSFWMLLGSIVLHLACVLALFSQARLGLSVIWKIQNTQANTFSLIVLDYLLAVAMLSFTILILFASLVVSSLVPDAPFLGDVFSFLTLTLALAVSYRVMSAEKIAWRNTSYRIPWPYVCYGAAIAALLFVTGKTFLQQYLLHLYASDDFYGRGGFLIVFLLWVYYCSQVYFFGAELIQARMTRSQWLDSVPTHVLA